jgi:hypothetical protein
MRREERPEAAAMSLFLLPTESKATFVTLEGGRWRRMPTTSI